MTQAGFGRKGLASEAVDDLARRREAFIAAERAQRTTTSARQEPAPSYVETPIARATYEAARQARPRKSLLIAYVLWFYCCIISAHQFYLGAWRSALTQVGLVFGGVLLVWIASATDTSFPGYIGAPALILALLWMLADVFLIPGIRRQMYERFGPGEIAATFA